MAGFVRDDSVGTDDTDWIVLIAHTILPYRHALERSKGELFKNAGPGITPTVREARDQIRDQDAMGQRRTVETHATSTAWRARRMVSGETDQAV